MARNGIIQSAAPHALNIVIIGAGIAGLSAAAALRKSNPSHAISIFERSNFLDEVGAAVLMTSNGTRVLKSLGFDFATVGGNRLQHFNAYDTLSLAPGPKMNIGNWDVETEKEKIFGGPIQSMHRQDLHQELLRLATEANDGEAKVTLHLGVSIASVDIEASSITLSDGKVIRADLLLGADGIHSIVRKAAAPGEGPPIDSGFQMYRFLLPTKAIEEDSVTRDMMERNTALRFFHGDPLKDDLSRFIWFECRNREVQSFVLFHRPVEGSTSVEDFKLPTDKPKVLEAFRHIHPNLLRIIEKSDHFLSWRIYERLPLPALVYGKTVLIGDAGHPMSPFSGQGANQALEDAGALMTLLSSENLAKHGLATLLQVFESVRRKRASRIQVVASVPTKNGNPLVDRMQEFVEADDQPKNLGFPDSFWWDYKYNVFEYISNALQKLH